MSSILLPHSYCICDVCMMAPPRLYNLSRCEHKLCDACVNNNLTYDLMYRQIMRVECPVCKEASEFDVKLGLSRVIDHHTHVAIQYMQAYD